MKKLITSLMLIALLIVSCTVVYGYADIQNTECFFCSLGYSGGTIKVLNVYTSGTPAAGNLVTIYTYSGSKSQKWGVIKNQNLPGISSDSYSVVSIGNTDVALNYHQADEGCTVYYYGSANYYQDYPIAFNTASGGGYTIWLYYRDDKYLGNTGSSNGDQCEWKTIDNNGISSENIWLML